MAEQEGKDTTVEGADQTAVKEDGKQTAGSEDSTVGKTYKTEEDFTRAVDKAVGKASATLLQKLDTQTKAAEAAISAVEALRIEQAEDRKRQDALEEARFQDDPEGRTAWLASKAARDEARRVEAKDRDATEKLTRAEKLVLATSMAARATELVAETGIDIDELKSCKTEQEMELKSLRFRVANPDAVNSGEGSKSGGKFDSTNSSNQNSGAPTSAHEKMKAGFAERNKK